MKFFDFVNERGGRVVLQAIDAPPVDFATAQPATPAAVAEVAPHVLVADDNIINQRLSTALLQSRGYTVTIVGDGTLGYPSAAPYDRILVTAGAPRVPLRRPSASRC